IFESESLPIRYEYHQGGQLAEIEKYTSFDSYPLIVTSRTESVGVLISAYNWDTNIVPYQVEFVSVENVCDCFPDYFLINRTQPLNLLSPGFPLGYCDKHKCLTQISLISPYNTREYVECLQIQFNSFHTQVDDLLHLTMPDEKRELISFGGEAQNIKFFTLDSPKFNLNFITNEIGLDTGFNLSIKYIQRNKECLCHGTDSNLKIFNERMNSVEKKFFGERCPFMDCFWEIKPPKDSRFYHRLIVKFNHTLADTNREFLDYCSSKPNIRSYDWRRSSSWKTIEFPVGHVSKSPYFLNRGDSLYLWYHREYSRFEEIIGNPNIQGHFNFNYEWREKCTCGDAHLKAEENYWNVLYSPDYPETYCDSMRCLWHLEAPEGHHIVVTISEFYTEMDHDFLTIFDGNDTEQEHMEMLSGRITFKKTIQSKQNIITISFHSDITLQMSGFVLWYKAVQNDDFLQNQQTSTELPSSNNFPSNNSSSNNSSSSHKFILFLSILFLIIGILFFISRSSNSPTNNRIENIFRQLWPSRIRSLQMIKYNLILILLLLLLLIFIIFTESAGSDNDCSCPREEIFDSNWKEGVIKSPGFPLKYCGSLDCKWNIQPAENSFIYARLESFATEERYDTLDVYQTRWNGSELIKLKQASLSGKRYDNPVDHLRFSSSINGGLLFHFDTDGSTHNLGFRISFSRGSNDGFVKV
uniref:CUB domain-containing protein n=1 Tax=Meloidogyne floridensis TaxID=298350 RepID=A0A915NMU9_9BILA